MMKKLYLTLFILPFALHLTAQNAEQPEQNPPGQGIVVGKYNPGTKEVTESSATLSPPERSVRIGFDFGFTYRMAKAAPGVDKDFINRMRPGYFYGFDIHGFARSGAGFGARFAGHHYGTSEFGAKCRVNTYYIAPSFMWRNFTLNSHAWYWGLSIGYLSYNEKLQEGDYAISFSKGGLGTTLDLGHDVRLSDDMFLGFKLTLTGGSVDTGMKDSSGNKITESLSAIDLSIGLRF